MSDLFEENEEDSSAEVEENMDEAEEVQPAEVDEAAPRDIDVRRRLESRLEERRLRVELDDFSDYD